MLSIEIGLKKAKGLIRKALFASLNKILIYLLKVGPAGNNL